MTERRGQGRGRGRKLYKQDPAIGGGSALNSYKITETGRVSPEVATSIQEEIPSSLTLLPTEMQLENSEHTAPPPVRDVPDPSTSLHVRITEVMDPSCFYAMVAHREDLELFDRMSSVLIEICEAHDPADNFLPRIDDIIGVNTTNFENFGLEYKWVRGRVIRILSKEDIEVILLDFGSAHHVEVSSICSRIPDSTLTSSLCMHCGLADCQPIIRDWSRDACDYFHSLISKFSPHLRGILFPGTILNPVITGLVLLGYDSNKGKWISFGHALIEAGHAVTYHNTNRFQYQSASHHQNVYTDQSQYLPMSVPSHSNTIDELQQGLSSLHMTSYDGERDAYLQQILTYKEQQLLHSLDSGVDFRTLLTSDLRIRSLDSVTDYEEFVPKVHPMDVQNGETPGGIGVSLPHSTPVETGERSEDKSSKESSEFLQSLPIVGQQIATKTTKSPTIPPGLAYLPPSGYKSPKGMGRGQVIKRNMQRARASNASSVSPVSNGELSMQIANITVTPEAPAKEPEYLLAVEMVQNPEYTDEITTQKSQPSNPKERSTPSSVGLVSKLDQEVSLAFEGEISTESSVSAKQLDGSSNRGGSAHADGDSNVDYSEEFEQSFGHSKNDSPNKPFRGRGRKSPAHWKQGVRCERRHKPPLPSGKDPHNLPIPLASKYVKSITSEAKNKNEPTLQETEIAHLKYKLAAQLDNLLGNFREETQKQFPDNIMKLMNDELANKLTTILGPNGPFLILLNCVFQRSIDQPNFLPFCFMVIARLYSMYKHVLTENLLPSLISTQILLLSKVKSDSLDAGDYKANYCQMVSACIDFVSSKDINQGLMNALESAILEILMNFAGSDLDLPIEDLQAYQIKADCLFTILEKSGGVLLNLTNDCFNKIMQEISYNIVEFKTMPFPLLNKYTCCLQLFEKVLSAGKQAPLGLTKLTPNVVMPTQQQEPLPYPNNTFQHFIPPNQQTDPRAQFHNLCNQQLYAPAPHPQYQSAPAPFQQGAFHSTNVAAVGVHSGYLPHSYYMQPQGQMFLPQNHLQQMPPPNQQQQQIQVPNQQQQQQPQPQPQQQQMNYPLQHQTSTDSSNKPLSPVQSTDPFTQVRSMLLSFKEIDQLKKFEDARIQDDLLTIEWLELEKILKDSSIPPALIFRIKRYLHHSTQQQQQQQQSQQQTSYTGSLTNLCQPVQDMNTNISNPSQLPTQQMYPPYWQQTDAQQSYYLQQQQQQQHSMGLSQNTHFQQIPQVLNPNINSNNNNNLTDPRYNLQAFSLQPSPPTAENPTTIQTQILQQQQLQPPQQQQLQPPQQPLQQPQQQPLHTTSEAQYNPFIQTTNYDQSNEYTYLPFQQTN